MIEITLVCFRLPSSETTYKLLVLEKIDSLKDHILGRKDSE